MAGVAWGSRCWKARQDATLCIPTRKDGGLDKGDGGRVNSLDKLDCVWEVKLGRGVAGWGERLDFMFVNSVFRMLLRL